MFNPEWFISRRICLTTKKGSVCKVKISELARKTKVSARMLRYYEDKGLIAPHRLDNGYRFYDDDLVERVEKIRCYADAGVPLNEITVILSPEQYSGQLQTPELPDGYAEMLLRERERMKDQALSLQQSIKSMTKLIEALGITSPTDPVEDGLHTDRQSSPQ